MGKPADQEVGFVYPQGGGDDIGVYKQPMSVADAKFGKEVATKKAGQTNEMNISLGNLSKGNYVPDETEGIKIRGTGAATKGTMARGSMA